MADNPSEKDKVTGAMAERTIEERVNSQRATILAMEVDASEMREGLEAHANNPLAHAHLATEKSVDAQTTRWESMHNDVKHLFSKAKEMDEQLNELRTLITSKYQAIQELDAISVQYDELSMRIDELGQWQSDHAKSGGHAGREHAVTPAPDPFHGRVWDDKHRRWVEPVDIERLAEVAHHAHYPGISWEGYTSPEWKEAMRRTVRAILKDIGISVLPGARNNERGTAERPEPEKWTTIRGHIVAPDGIDIGGNLHVEGNINLWKPKHIIAHIVNQAVISEKDATIAYRIVIGDWPVSIGTTARPDMTLQKEPPKPEQGGE